MWTILIVIMVFLSILFVVKVLYVISTAIALPATKGALYVSTSRNRISAVLDAVPMKKDQLLVDLGCGDGRVLRMVKKRYSAKAVGYEINPMAYLRARMQSAGRGIKIKYLNYLKANLSDADVVFCYLFPDVMKELAAKLKSELKKGAVIVSCNFAFPGMTPEQVIKPDGELDHDPIYIYSMAEDRERRTDG